MPFVKATIIIKPASVGTGIKAGLRKVKGGAKLSLFISGEGQKALGLSDKDKCEVLIGDGQHHGLLRIRKNNSVGEAEVVEKAARYGTFFIVGLGHQAAFVDRTETSLWCQWEKVDDGWVEIVLPKWASETGSRSKPAPNGTTPLRHPVAPPAPQKKASVTAELMGDPPIGRREMLEKIGKVKP